MRYILPIIFALASFTHAFAVEHDYDAEAALALAAAKKPIPKQPDPIIPSPVVIPGNIGNGHTHTCANGHTWNHAVHAGHNCPICGLAQYVQDSTPRAVNLGSQSFQSIGSGCANGQCQSPPQRRGLFGRLR